MSKHQPIEGYEDDGTPTPDLAYIATDRKIRTAAQAAGRRRGQEPNQLILNELDVPALDPPVVACTITSDPHQRLYGTHALLTKEPQTINVIVGTDPAELTDYVTDVGMALIEPILGIYGISYLVIGRHDLLVNIGTAFEWDDSYCIDEQIICLMARTVTPDPDADDGHVVSMRLYDMQDEADASIVRDETP